MNQMAPRHPRPQSQRDFAQEEVESLLHRSASFKALPQDQQAEVLQNTRKVVGFIADAGGEHLLRHAVGAKAMNAYNKSQRFLMNVSRALVMLRQDTAAKNLLSC